MLIQQAGNQAGIWIQFDAEVVISNNTIINNDRTGGNGADIDYSMNNGQWIMISLNVYDYINKSMPNANGSYNVTSAGGPINP